jgi:Squalene/phytoene synthase
VKNLLSVLQPPRVLAIAYAPTHVRGRLAWLLALDQRLSDVLGRASEPMIAQLRLSWWRDALNAAPEKQPKGEPLLSELAAIRGDDVLISASLSLIDAFEILALQTESQERADAQMQRISAICNAFAHWIGDRERNAANVDKIARWWLNPDSTMPKPVSRPLRSLSILAFAEKLDDGKSRSSPLRLNWHALTGR